MSLIKKKIMNTIIIFFIIITFYLNDMNNVKEPPEETVFKDVRVVILV